MTEQPRKDNVSFRQLKQFRNVRRQFAAEFVRFGIKSGWYAECETVLLRNVKHGGQLVADHVWFNLTKGFEALGSLTEGDVIEFEARAEIYEKGYKGHSLLRQLERPITSDWKLVRPTKVKRVAAASQTQPPSPPAANPKFVIHPA